MPRARYAQNKNYYVALGRQIAQVRQSRSKMTQEDLALKISLTRTSIINIEKGRQQLLVHTLVDIATALGVALPELLPPSGDVAHLLRDVSKQGRDWVLSSVATASKGRKES